LVCFAALQSNTYDGPHWEEIDRISPPGSPGADHTAPSSGAWPIKRIDKRGVAD
jgi:hypothetical protein